MCATTAPWALGVGMLVSFTASAGQDLSVGVSVAPGLAASASLDAGDLVPQAPGLVSASLGLAPGARSLGALGQPASGLLLAGSPHSDSPKSDLKRGAAGGGAPRFPKVVREGKGAPAGAIKASLSRAGRDVAMARAARQATKLLFTHDDRLLPGTIMMEGAVEVPELSDVMRFESAEDDLGATLSQSSEASPPADLADATGVAGAIDEAPAMGPLFGSARRAARVWRKPSDARDGGTPATPRAMALASATPAPPEATPMEIAAAPVIQGREMTVVARLNPGRPDYASLIDPRHLEREKRCLAEAVYFEARSEPAEGQAAVAQVVLNRVKSGLYPRSICGVVYQNRHRHLACQFTFACEGKKLVTNETHAWNQAVRVANAVYSGQTYLAEVGGATHYHANYVRPRWARKLKKNDVIGRHIFYQLRPGQT